MADPNTLDARPGIGIASAGVLGFISIDDLIDLFEGGGKHRSSMSRDFEQRALEMGADSALTPFKSTRVGRIFYLVVTGGKVLKAIIGGEPEAGSDPVFGPLDLFDVLDPTGTDVVRIIDRVNQERLLITQAGTTEIEPTWVGDP